MRDRGRVEGDIVVEVEAGLATAYHCVEVQEATANLGCNTITTRSPPPPHHRSRETRSCQNTKGTRAGAGESRCRCNGLAGGRGR
jgi:hypothetical protein